MSQYVLLRHALPPPGGLRLRSIATEGDFFAAVLDEYAFLPAECRILTDADGAAEPLVDDFHDAVRPGRAIADTPFGEFAETLIQREVEFLCWCGADFKDLPVVRSWDGFVSAIEEQIADQPADLFLHYLPGDLTWVRS